MNLNISYYTFVVHPWTFKELVFEHVKVQSWNVSSFLFHCITCASMKELVPKLLLKLHCFFWCFYCYNRGSIVTSYLLLPIFVLLSSVLLFVESIYAVTGVRVPWFLHKCSAFLFSDYVGGWSTINLRLSETISDENFLIQHNLVNWSYVLFTLLGFLHKVNHDKFL